MSPLTRVKLAAAAGAVLLLVGAQPAGDPPLESGKAEYYTDCCLELPNATREWYVLTDDSARVRVLMRECGQTTFTDSGWLDSLELPRRNCPEDR